MPKEKCQKRTQNACDVRGYGHTCRKFRLKGSSMTGVDYVAGGVTEFVHPVLELDFSQNRRSSLLTSCAVTKKVAGRKWMIPKNPKTA